MMHSDLEDIERLEKLEEIILELKEFAQAGAIIIVEGRKDEVSLRYLGINGDFQFASQQPLLDLTDSLPKTGKDIVLLTDWDKRGSLVARKIIKHLSAYGIVPNTEIRLRLRSLQKKE